MTELHDRTTIGEAWHSAVQRHPDRPVIIIPASPARDFLPDGLEISYAEASGAVERLIDAYANAGYGLGHRVSLLLDNRPEHLLHRLALNCLGVSCVPINPDYRPAEIAYLIDHSEPELILVLRSRAQQIADGLALAETRNKPHVQILEDVFAPPPPRTAPQSGSVTPATEAEILYTSGTTGRPKGCILSHGYEISSGAWYATRPGRAAVQHGAERIYNPLPLYHCNSGVVSFYGAVLTGGAQIQSERFHPERWWREIRQTKASIVHYLGVIVPMLLAQPPSELDKQHDVRFAFGAGCEPQLHAPFEARFGFPLLEGWGMTEMVRILIDSVEPRQIGTRAFGRAQPGVDIRVVDDHDQDVADGTPGEMVLRHSAESPRRGAFSGYLKNPQETEKSWRGGWFHTGDTVYRAPGGMLHFVDRKKNIIRRSGENVAAAEIEALLLTHPDVLQVAVMAVKDEVREEEVLACLVLKSGGGDKDKAASLFRFCHERLAYYKAPGWIWFTRELPTTGTQKIQKHTIFPGIADPRQASGMLDLRSLKKRT